MKKKLLSILLVLFIVTMFTGCGNEAKPNSTGNNTSTGTNPNGESNNSNTNTTANLEKNITTSGAITKRGKLVVIATNGNNVPVDMEIEVEFYDKDGNIVGSDEEDFSAVGAGSEVAVEMHDTPASWDNYKIYADVEETEKTSYVDKVEIKHSNNGKNIAVQVTNNSDDTIEWISVAVVYYQGEEIVGIEDGLESDIKPGRSGNFNIYYASDKNYKDVKFDKYKVFVNEAYSYNW